MSIKSHSIDKNNIVDIGSLDGLKLWLKLGSTVRESDGSQVESGDLVKFWDDSSGQSNDFTQTSSDRQPRYIAGTFTGVLFDGSTTTSQVDRMSCSSTISAEDFTLIVAMDLTNASPDNEMFISEFGNTNSRISLLQGSDGDRIQIRFDDGTTEEICDLEDLSQDIPTTPFLLTIKRDTSTSNNVKVRFDRKDVTDLSDTDTGTDANNDSAMIDFIFDTIGVGGANSLEYQGFIAEVVFFDKALGELTLARVEKDIMDRNGL